LTPVAGVMLEKAGDLAAVFALRGLDASR